MRHLMVVAGCLLISSCATNVVDPIDYNTRDYKSQQNNRLIYRDLTVPKAASVSPAKSKNTELAEITRELRNSKKEEKLVESVQDSEAEPVMIDEEHSLVSASNISKPYYVPFDNESFSLPADHQTSLNTIVKNHKKGNRYVVMGHSHGKSLVGTSKLALARAEVVSKWLINNGVNKTSIHQTASWGDHSDSLAPPKGVMVYVTSETNGRFLLALTPYEFFKENEHEQPKLASTGS